MAFIVLVGGMLLLIGMNMALALVLTGVGMASRDFERQDTRKEAAGAVAELKKKGMQVNELSPAEAARMLSSLTRVYASIGASVGMELWNETQAELAKLRGKK